MWGMHMSSMWDRRNVSPIFLLNNLVGCFAVSKCYDTLSISNFTIQWVVLQKANVIRSSLETNELNQRDYYTDCTSLTVTLPSCQSILTIWWFPHFEQKTFPKSVFWKVSNLRVKLSHHSVDRNWHFCKDKQFLTQICPDFTVACSQRLKILEKLLGSHNIWTEEIFWWIGANMKRT